MIKSKKDTNYVRTIWGYFIQGFIAAHKRRPLSFYLLLLIPVVLLLGVHISDYREYPWRFATLLALIFIFFWLIIFIAFNDLFFMYRKHLMEKRAVYLETIGNREFAETLGDRVRENNKKRK